MELLFAVFGGFIIGFATCCWVSPIDPSDWGDPEPSRTYYPNTLLTEKENENDNPHNRSGD